MTCAIQLGLGTAPRYEGGSHVANSNLPHFAEPWMSLQCRRSNWLGFFASADHSVDHDKGASCGSSYSSRRWVQLQGRWSVRRSAIDNASLAGSHGTQGKAQCKPRLFTTRIGMAAYIHWRRIPERSQQITKAMYSIKSGPIPDSIPSVHCQRP